MSYDDYSDDTMSFINSTVQYDNGETVTFRIEHPKLETISKSIVIPFPVLNAELDGSVADFESNVSSEIRMSWSHSGADYILPWINYYDENNNYLGATAEWTTESFHVFKQEDKIPHGGTQEADSIVFSIQAMNFINGALEENDITVRGYSQNCKVE